MRRPGEALGTRCEIKNVNSIRFVQQAIEYEARRQVEVIEEGGTIRQETRLFDSGRGDTRTMRSKEDAHDYRYFPDPDLLPLELDPAWVERLKTTLPELPDAKKARFMADFGLSPYDAGVLVADQETAHFYETVAKGRDAKLAANWVISELFGALNKAGVDIRIRRSRPRRSAGWSISSPTTPSPAASPRTSSPRWSRPARMPRPSSRRRACAR